MNTNNFSTLLTGTPYRLCRLGYAVMYKDGKMWIWDYRSIPKVIVKARSGYSATETNLTKAEVDDLVFNGVTVEELNKFFATSGQVNNSVTYEDFATEKITLVW